MNRSWFRNPFSGNSSKGMGEDGDEQAEEEANADGELPVSMGDRSNGSSGWNTKKRKRRAKAGGALQLGYCSFPHAEAATFCSRPVRHERDHEQLVQRYERTE